MSQGWIKPAFHGARPFGSRELNQVSGEGPWLAGGVGGIFGARRVDSGPGRASSARPKGARARGRREPALVGQSMFYETSRNDHGLAHDPIKSCVVPRPIGWISTLSSSGIVNLAP